MSNRKSLLAGKMAEKGVSNRMMSQRIGITEVAFCNKKNGKTEFKPSEWKIMLHDLEVPDDEAGKYIYE